jgi:hypothetical protein
MTKEHVRLGALIAQRLGFSPHKECRRCRLYETCNGHEAEMEQLPCELPDELAGVKPPDPKPVYVRVEDDEPGVQMCHLHLPKRHVSMDDYS